MLVDLAQIRTENELKPSSDLEHQNNKLLNYFNQIYGTKAHDQFFGRISHAVKEIDFQIKILINLS